MEENVYSYCLEVHGYGQLYIVTEYMNGYIQTLPANANIETEGKGYIINLYED